NFGRDSSDRWQNAALLGHCFAGRNAQSFADRALLCCKVGNRVAGENLKERTQRFAQRAIEIAFTDKRAVCAFFEALREREIFFSEADCIEQGNLIGRLAQPYAAMPPAYRFKQAVLDQWLDQLEQEKL